MEKFEQSKDFQQEEEKEILSSVEEKVLKLREPTRNILEQISSLLESGEVQLIIGDDASGRIPTEIFRKIFELNSKERGFTSPETRFIAGSRDVNEEAAAEKKNKINEYITRVKSDIEKKFGRPLDRALVVTDTIYSGQSLDLLMEALRENGVKTSVVSIGVEGSAKRSQRIIEERWGASIVAGSDTTPEVYSVMDMAGVIKNSNDLFSSSISAREIYRRNPKARDVLHETINRSREAADELATEAYEEWKETRKKD